MRGLAERAAELTAEMRLREMRRLRERGDVERVAVAGVDQVLRTEQIARGRVRLHRPSIAAMQPVPSPALDGLPAQVGAEGLQQVTGALLAQCGRVELVEEDAVLGECQLRAGTLLC